MNYGSLQNHLYGNGTNGQPEPTVGMGATILYYTDRKACTIIKVEKTKNTIYIDVQRDKSTRADKNGMSDCQDYNYSPDSNGAVYTFKFNNKKQKWQKVNKNPETGRYNLCEDCGLIIGTRKEYYDFSF